jgi:hypothetical protein
VKVIACLGLYPVVSFDATVVRELLYFFALYVHYLLTNLVKKLNIVFLNKYDISKQSVMQYASLYIISSSPTHYKYYYNIKTLKTG